MAKENAPVEVISRHDFDAFHISQQLFSHHKLHCLFATFVGLLWNLGDRGLFRTTALLKQTGRRRRRVKRPIIKAGL